MRCPGCLSVLSPLKDEPQWRDRFCPACDDSLTPSQHRRIEASDARVRAAVRKDLDHGWTRRPFPKTRLAMTHHELGRVLHEAGLPGAAKYLAPESTGQASLFDAVDDEPDRTKRNDTRTEEPR